MAHSNQAGFLGLLLALAALNGASALPAAAAAAAETTIRPQEHASAQDPASIDARLRRISALIQERGAQHGLEAAAIDGEQLAYGFLNGGRVGWGNARGYGGFGNYHPYYGGGGGFLNGGGGWGNGRYHPGGGWGNGRHGGFANW